MDKVMVFNIYGIDGHRQKESFNKSHCFGGNDFFVSIENSDITGTNEYSHVTIRARTKEQCLDILNGQLSDGVFENCNVGLIELCR